MKELVTELLREKFVLHDPAVHLKGGKGPTIALSNRVVINLNNDKGKVEETIAVRAQNMHSCVRMAARILQTYNSNGPLLDRPLPFEWDAAWDVASGDYEQNFNPLRWVAVYSKGKVIFEKGDRHPFFDIIENCDAAAKGKYAESLPLAENVIRQSGKVIRIEYDGNVALVVNLEKKQGRCGLIIRSPNKTTTFNFSVTSKNKDGLNFAQCIGSAAAFLEGVQLAFMVGMGNEKIKRGIIPRHSMEEKQIREGGIRLGRLNAEIANLESTFEVRYRPERPEFGQILAEAEKVAQKMLTPPPTAGKRG